MAQAKYLIDTNAIIDYLGGKLPHSGMEFLEKIIPQYSFISIISKIELLGFNTTKKHSELLKDFINAMEVIGLTSEIVNETILIRKNNKLKLPDSIIAATAGVQNVILITRNISDFETISNLQTLNPHTIT